MKNILPRVTYRVPAGDDLIALDFSPPKSQVWLRELFTGYLLTPRGTWTIGFDLACIKIFDFTLVGLGFLGVALVPFYIGCDFF